MNQISNLTTNINSSEIPSLNGLRAISIITVMLAHLVWNKFPGGFGVAIFFFISGFLITLLLIREHRETGKIALAAFYIRRLLRLYPALIVFLISASAVAAFYQKIDLMTLLAALFYFMNYYFSYSLKTEISVPVGHTWSLSVEEHFYMLFPVILGFVISKSTKAQVYVIASLIVIPLILRCLYAGLNFDIKFNYYLTETRIDSIAWGCLLAILASKPDYQKYLLKLASNYGLIISLIVLIVSFAIRSELFRETLRYTLQGAALFVVFIKILNLDPASKVYRILNSKPADWIGKLSYSLYLWHGLWVWLMYQVLPENQNFSFAIIGLTGSLITACISYYYVEKPFLNMRKNFTRKYQKPEYYIDSLRENAFRN